MGQNRFDHMGIVGHAQLVGDGQQQRIGLGDRLVLLQLFDEDVRLRGTASSEDGACLFVDITDLIDFLAAAGEIGAIAIVDEREDAATDRGVIAG